MPDERPPRKKTDPNQCERMNAGNMIAAQAVATVLERSEGRRLHPVPNSCDTDTNGTVTDHDGCGGSSVNPSFVLFPVARIVSEPIYTGSEPAKAPSKSSPRSCES